MSSNCQRVALYLNQSIQTLITSAHCLAGVISGYWYYWKRYKPRAV